MRYLLIKNWSQYQHYKKRSPAWIKLHRVIVEDYAFATLKDKTKAHLMLIWVLAAGTEGRIPNDAKFIASKISAQDAVDLEAMVQAGFLVPDTNGADSKDDAQAPSTRIAGATQATIERRAAAKRVLSYLNEQAGKSFQDSDANLAMIEARLGEYDEKMLRGVIVDRVGQWKDNEEMREYLRPATLFNKTKCAQYVGELPT